MKLISKQRIKLHSTFYLEFKLTNEQHAALNSMDPMERLNLLPHNVAMECLEGDAAPPKIMKFSQKPVSEMFQKAYMAEKTNIQIRLLDGEDPIVIIKALIDSFVEKELLSKLDAGTCLSDIENVLSLQKKSLAICDEESSPENEFVL